MLCHMMKVQDFRVRAHLVMYYNLIIILFVMLTLHMQICV